MADAIQAGLKRPNVRTPRFELPNWLVRLVALFDRQIRDNTAELGRTRPVNGDAGRALLRRATIPGPEAVTATAESLFVHGLLKA